MASNKLSGSLLGVEIKDKWVACETSCDFNFDSEMIDASSVSSGRWKEIIAGMRSWSVSVNANMLIQASDSDFTTIINAFISGERMKVRIRTRVAMVGSIVITGYVIAQSGGLNAAYGSTSGWNTTLQGDGEFILGDKNQYQALFGYTLNDPFGNELNLKPQFSKYVDLGSNSIAFDWTVGSSAQFLFAILPKDQPVFNVWENNQFNFGDIPDFLWRNPVSIGNYNYYMTRSIQYITSSVPVITLKRKASMPTAFTFTSIINVVPSSEQLSNIVTLSGMTEALSVRSDNGFVSINGGAYVTSGLVNNGDTIRAKQISPSGFLQSGTTTVTVGSYSTGFTVSTKESTPIQLRTSVSQGVSPFTQAGYSINGNYIVQPEESTNNFDGLFKQGDSLTIDFTSLVNNYPWEINSKAIMIIKVNDLVVKSFDISNQSANMGTYVLNTDGNTNKIDINIFGSSTAEDRITQYLNTYLFNTETGEFRIQLNDDNDSRAKLNVYPIANGNRLRYNVIDDGNNLTGFLENNSDETRFIYIEGTNFAMTYTIYPFTILTAPGIPKSQLYLFDVEMNGYVRRGDFTKNNCGGGVGGVVPFAKAYINQAAADADTTNFNNLGQQNANTFGSCS